MLVLSLLAVLKKVIRFLSLPIRTAATRLGLVTFSKRQVEGFVIVDWAGLGNSFPSHVHRLQIALELIKEKDPRRYKRIQRDVARFLVAETAGAEYLPSVRACLISAASLLGRPIEEVALTIVHEATHARFHTRGIGYDKRRRERIELACVGEEIAFCALLSDGEKLATRAGAKLVDKWWTEENELARRLQALEQLGWPSWYRQLYAFLYKPR